MPLYHVTETDRPDRLIEATTPSVAVRFAMGERIKAKAVSDPMQVIDLMGKGLAVEKSVAEQASEPTAEPAAAEPAAA